MTWTLKLSMCLCALVIGQSGLTEGRQLHQAPAGTGREINWVIPSSGSLSNVTVPVGASVTFTWSGQHNVYEVNSYACPASFTGANAKQLAETASGGSVAVPVTSSGTRYFACGVGNHCSRGQLVAIIATGGPSAAPGPARAPAASSTG